jgi:anti-sigma factor RsiW
MTCEQVLEILDAYVDGELDTVNRQEVEWHLSECAGCRRRMESRRALAAALQKKLPYYRMPEELREKVLAVREKGGNTVSAWRRSAMALAACLAVALCALGLVVANGRGGESESHEQQVAAAVLEDHLRSLEGLGDSSQVAVSQGHLVDVVSSDQRAVRPWLAAKLPFEPSVRKPEGYELVGGRLDVVLRRPVAAMVYWQRNHLIDLFTWPAQKKGEKAEGFAAVDLGDGYRAVKWTDSNGMEYWAVSDAEGPAIMQFAKAFDAAGA